MTQTPEKIRAGVVGVGHMGRYHVVAYSELFKVEVIGVCDTDPEKAEATAAPFNYPWFTDYRNLFGKVDVVSIAVPTELHFAVAKDFLEHDIHVLLEKPVTPTLAEAEQLFELAAKRNLALHIGHVERFNGALQEMKKIISNPFLVESRRIGPWTGRSVQTGVVMDLMIHDIDIVLNLVDKPVADLHVMGRKVRSDYEDIVSLHIDFENGAMGSLLASRVSEEKIRTLDVQQRDAYIHLDYATQDIQIHRGASSSYQIMSNSLNYRQESVIERLFVHRGNPLKHEIQHFLDNAMANGDRLISVDKELRSLKVALKVLEKIRDA
ncbi:MAG: Gfo/Idh/MocA family oxidoreductase [Candidatus Lernaella stagnicola]|nr:Gfo/Idh/MocA family oxidoreductase [Candidatus Lernaella stagnicola]